MGAVRWRGVGRQRGGTDGSGGDSGGADGGVGSGGDSIGTGTGTEAAEGGTDDRRPGELKEATAGQLKNLLRDRLHFGRLVT